MASLPDNMSPLQSSDSRLTSFSFLVVVSPRPWSAVQCSASGARVGAHLLLSSRIFHRAAAAAEAAAYEEVEGVWPGAAVTSLPVAVTE